MCIPFQAAARPNTQLRRCDRNGSRCCFQVPHPLHAGCVCRSVHLDQLLRYWSSCGACHQRWLFPDSCCHVQYRCVALLRKLSPQRDSTRPATCVGSTSFCSSLHTRWASLLCVLFLLARFLFVRANPRGLVFWCTAMYHESLLTTAMPPGIRATSQSYMGDASASQLVSLLQWRPVRCISCYMSFIVPNCSHVSHIARNLYLVGLHIAVDARCSSAQG